MGELLIPQAQGLIFLQFIESQEMQNQSSPARDSPDPRALHPQAGSGRKKRGTAERLHPGGSGQVGCTQASRRGSELRCEQDQRHLSNRRMHLMKYQRSPL